MTLPSIRTERLRLRPWGLEDVDVLHRLWIDPEVRRYLWDDVVISRDRAAEAVAAHFASLARHGFGCWIIHAEDVDVIGFCGFRPMSDRGEPELLYGLLPQYWGRGLATEASRAALEYLWSHTSCHRVFAKTDTANTKSVEVMRRLGMRFHEADESTITYVLERPV